MGEDQPTATPALLLEDWTAFESVLRAVGGDTAVLSPNGTLTWASPRWNATIQSLQLPELTLGHDYWHALHAASDLHTDRVDALIHAIEQVRQGQQSQVALEMSWNDRNRDKTRHVRIEVLQLAHDFLLLQIRDITARRNRESHLAYMAYHDPVTGLPNRFAVSASIEHALNRSSRSGVGIGLLFCDLDDFKQVNDTYGHRAGDELLKQIAKRWQHWIRSTDTLARISGDEFVLVADGVSGPDELAGLAHRLSVGIKSPFTAYGQDIRVSTSIGAVFVQAEMAKSTSEAGLLDEADRALYAAKRQGSDQIVVRTSASSISP